MRRKSSRPGAAAEVTAVAWVVARVEAEAAVVAVGQAAEEVAKG